MSDPNYSHGLRLQRRRLELPLLGAAWVAIVAVSLAEAIEADLGGLVPAGAGLFYAVVGTFAIGINALAALLGKEIQVRKLFITLGVLAATGIMIMESISQPSLLLISLRHYLILIQVCKLFDSKTSRDYGQMLVMSLLLIVCGAMSYDNLWFACAATLALALACYSAMVLLLHRRADDAARLAVAAEHRRSAQAQQQAALWHGVRYWPARALWGGMASVLATAAVMAVVMFLAAPRQAGGGGVFGLAGHSLSGFATSVHLGGATQLHLSDEVVMHVALRGPRGQTNWRPADGLYLRGIVYDTYGGTASSWSRPLTSRTMTWPAAPRDVLDDTFTQDVTMSPLLLPTLFACGPLIDGESSDGSLLLRPLYNAELSLAKLPPGPVRYTARSLAIPQQAAHREYLHDPPGPDQAASYNASLIAVSPAVRQLAREWCEDLLAGPPELHQADQWRRQVAERISMKLAQRCHYSLDLSQGDDEIDGVEDFLFRSHAGNCEYFASALAVMCHSLGVNSRLATGYHVDGRNLDNGRYVVRQRDAHAWVELYLPSQGWTVFDPTPSGSVNHAPNGFLAWLSRKSSDLEFLWYEKVLGYNSASRRALGESIWDGLSALWKQAQDATDMMGNSIVRLLSRGEADTAMVGFAVLVGVAAMGVEAVLAGRLIRRRLALRREKDPLALAQRETSFIMGFMAELHRRGLNIRPGQTLLEACHLASTELALDEQTLVAMADMQYRLRWGQQVPSAEQVESYRLKVQQWMESLPRRLHGPSSRQ